MSPKNNREQNMTSLPYPLPLTILISLFLLLAPFSKALFNGGAGLVNMNQFERPIYYSFLLSAVLLGFIAAVLYYTWKPDKMRGVFSIFIWVLPLSYAVSWTVAASPHVAKNAVFIQFVYVAFFLAALYLPKESDVRRLMWAVLGAGYVVVWYGFANLFGNAYYRDAVMVDGAGLRLTSVFQYANAYAAYLIALFLAGMVVLLSSRSRWAISVQALMIVPVLTSFLLTLSRGGLVVFPVAALLVLPFFRFVQQAAFLAYTALGAVGAVLISAKMTDRAQEMLKRITDSLSGGPEPKPTFLYPITDPLPWPKWLLLIGCSAAVGAVVTFCQVRIVPVLEERAKRWNARGWVRFALPAAAVVVGTVGLWALLKVSATAGWLPEQLRTRLENINFRQHSVLERGTFYEDSFKLFLDYPIIGKGGGAWAVMYEQYQNNPYTSRQAHSFYLQYLNETGLVGLLALLALMGWIYVRFVRVYASVASAHSGVSTAESRGRLTGGHNADGLADDGRDLSTELAFFAFSTALLIHSAIDFEMSYVYLAALVFLCLGCLARVDGDRPAPFAVKIGEVFRTRTARAVFPTAVLAVAAVFFVMSGIFLTANGKFRQAIQAALAGKPYSEVVVPLDEALRLQPRHPEYLQQKLSFVLQVYQQSGDPKYLDEAEKLLDALKRHEPYVRSIVDYDYEINRLRGRPEQSIPTLEDALVKYPWNIHVYELAAGLYAELGERARLAARRDEAERYYARIEDLVEHVKEKERHLATLPKEQLPGRPFGMTPTLAASLGYAYFGRGMYAETEALLKPYLNAALDEPADRAAARLYLAALRKQGRDDEALYRALVGKDAEEAERVRALTEGS